MSLCEHYKFPSLFINQFYPRPGTPAARMPRLPAQEVLMIRTVTLCSIVTCVMHNSCSETWLINKGFWCDFDRASSLICGNKMPTRFAGCCSILQTGHITLNSTPDQQLENNSTKYHRQQPLYNTLELLMMGTVVPETCWASSKICNKKPLLHLVGILFPHD